MCRSICIYRFFFFCARVWHILCSSSRSFLYITKMRRCVIPKVYNNSIFGGKKPALSMNVISINVFEKGLFKGTLRIKFTYIILCWTKSKWFSTFKKDVTNYTYIKNNLQSGLILYICPHFLHIKWHRNLSQSTVALPVFEASFTLIGTLLPFNMRDTDKKRTTTFHHTNFHRNILFARSLVFYAITKVQSICIFSKLISCSILFVRPFFSSSR